MSRTLLVPDFQVHHILAIFRALTYTVLIQAMVTYGLLKKQIPYVIIVISVVWGSFTAWSQLIVHDGWKILTDEEHITNRLLKRNRTHFQIGNDGEGAAVDEMFKGSYTLDTSGLDEVHALKEMKSFLAALKILVTQGGVKETPIMDNNMKLENYTDAFIRTK